MRKERSWQAVPPEVALQPTGKERLSQLGARLARSENLYGLAFVGPLIIGLVLFTYGPVLYSGWLSLNEGDFIRPLRGSG